MDKRFRMRSPQCPAGPSEERGFAAGGFVDAWMVGDEGSRECATALLGSLRRVRRWRVPPRWSERDWFEEITAEMVLTVLHAAQRFDPARGVPRKVFLYKQIIARAYARYRCEWKYAIREASRAELDWYDSSEGREDSISEAEFRLLQHALGRLSREDLGLIEGLFWGERTEPEFARAMGVTQQAVNKRKRTIFKALRSWICKTAIISE